MSDQDIVARLRVPWEAMGDMANAERAEAATEIENLRGERDMARRMYCLMIDWAEPNRVAERHEWDCFKEERQ